ncbi:MAG: hypothetical protein AB8G11_01730 [Saprospiraceae bacterium]
MKNLHLILGILLIVLNSCISVRNTPEKLIKPLYSASIEDAAYPTKDEINYNLIEINESNTKLKWKTIDGKKYILTATWVAEKDLGYYTKSSNYKTGTYSIWVTAIPDLKERCEALKIEKSKDMSLRIEQLLGLPPNGDKTHFIEFWVQPKDLFRPCPDESITDGSCDLCFPEGTNDEYKKWINNLRVKYYYNCEGDRYPWTQLGYTYDWHPRNKTHVGLSEFVIRANSDIIVHKIQATEKYLGIE